MVTRVESWKASDGRLFDCPSAAAKHEAIEALKKMETFNHASAAAIVDKAAVIVPLLQQVLDALDERRASVIRAEMRNA